MKPKSVKLYVKPGCPWCDEAREALRIRGVQYQEIDVIAERSAMEEMKRLTGQTRAPSIDIDGHVLADFGAHEFDVWWVKMGFDGSD